MTALLATRAARRRWIAFVVLLVLSVMLMGFSSNPAVREVQNGVSFAFRPIQGALDGAADSASSVLAAIAEIDRLRVDNAALHDENERLAAENARLEEIRRENESLTALLQLRAGFDYKAVATSVIARESSEFRRLVVLDKGSDDGISVGDVVVAAGGSLAGRVVEVGPASAKVVLLTDSESTVIGQLTTNAATGEVVGQLGGVLIMRQIDAGEKVAPGDEVVTAGIELGGGVRSPYPKGLAHRPGRRRQARRQRRRADRVPPAGRPARQARVPARHHRLRRRPAADRAAARRLRDGRHLAAGRAAVPLSVAAADAEPRAEPGTQRQALTVGARPRPDCYASSR